MTLPRFAAVPNAALDSGKEHTICKKVVHTGGRSPRMCPASSGGMGKTQTALEYAYRYAHHSSAIFWIEAETTESISTSFVRIANRLELPQAPQADHAQIFTWVERWLSQHHGWLLDNVEDP